nr:Flp family type IVb pilin [uncultured Duganella sp.]
MNSFIAAARAFASDEDGITAIEYGLIAATMVAVVATAFSVLGPTLADAFKSINTAVKNATGGTAAPTTP